MKVNAFVAAGLGSLILASAASADFTNITAEFTGTASAPGDTGFWAVRIYANFSSADDRLLSVIGAEYSSADTSAQELYRNAFGGVGVEPDAALIPVFPDLQWTSFVTIGHTQTVVGQATTSLDPDGVWSAVPVFTGGYFIPGDAPQGLAGSGLKVLIAQLTIQNPDASAGVAGTATVAWEAGGIAGGTQFSEIDFEYFIPAPGALALLGLAGLAGRRRR